MVGRGSVLVLGRTGFPRLETALRKIVKDLAQAAEATDDPDIDGIAETAKARVEKMREKIKGS